MLSAINAVFSEQRINIAGQYLQTNAKIGYVVIDVETREPAETLQSKAQAGQSAGHHPHARSVLKPAVR